MATGKQKGSVAIQSLLHDDKSTFAALYQRSTELQIFQEKLKAKLPSPLCDHFILANIDKTTLTLHTDSPAWAARGWDAATMFLAKMGMRREAYGSSQLGFTGIVPSYARLRLAR